MRQEEIEKFMLKFLLLIAQIIKQVSTTNEKATKEIRTPNVLNERRKIKKYNRWKKKKKRNK
jgi:hypothetical protein